MPKKARNIFGVPYQVAPKSYDIIKEAIFNRLLQRMAVLMESIEQHPLEDQDKVDIQYQLAIKAAQYCPEDK